MNISWRLATAGDLIRYYGSPRPQTLRAVVVLRDDEPVGLIGLTHSSSIAHFFSEYRPDFAPQMKTFMGRRVIQLALKRAMQFVIESKKPVIAVCDEGTHMLERLGFEQVEGETYRWPH